MQVIASWSGGKDSSFAYYKALQEGHEVKHLLNFISKEYRRCCFHGTEAKLLKLQAELVGIPLVQREVSPDMQNYEREFKDAVCELQAEGVKGMVFGDVYLLDHRNWVERVCGDLNIEPIQPLWNIPTSEIIEEFINCGFRAIVVSCQADLFGKEFVGRYIDRDFVEELKKKNVCLCGENGEFHTLVVDGPIFEKRIEITKSRPVLREGFWKYWFLDIQDYRACSKENQVSLDNVNDQRYIEA